MKFLRPEARDPFESAEAQRLYRGYIETSQFPESVELYLRAPITWEHNSNGCPHDFYLRKFAISDPFPGDDVDANNARIAAEVVLFCPKRRVGMIFSYERVQHADIVISTGKWHGKLPQVIADEVTLDGEEVVHEWRLDYGRIIKIKCRSFKRVILNE